MLDTIILGLNLLGTKAIIGYVVIVLIIVAVAFYLMRRTPAGRY